MTYSTLLEIASKKFEKAKDTEAFNTIQIAIQHTKEIAQYVDDMMLARKIKGFAVMFLLFSLLFPSLS